MLKVTSGLIKNGFVCEPYLIFLLTALQNANLFLFFVFLICSSQETLLDLTDTFLFLLEN